MLFWWWPSFGAQHVLRRLAGAVSPVPSVELLSSAPVRMMRDASTMPTMPQLQPALHAPDAAHPAA